MGDAILHVRLFGEFELRYHGELLSTFASARAASLLAYIILHRHAPQSRQRIAFLLWPDSSETQARTNLRHVLHNLRHALPDADSFLDIRPRTLQWRKDAPAWIDIAAFEALVTETTVGNEDDASDALREALDLYRGDLLEENYDDWLIEQRERYRAEYEAALERLITYFREQGNYPLAISYAERLLRHDPLREETYRLLMQLHAASGDHVRAMRIFHDCVSTLERELGIEPSASTHETYEALVPVDRETSVAGGSLPRLRETPLIGRTLEWEQITKLWRATERGRAQLVVVSGEPGIGKTRLVEEFRSWCRQRGALSAEARSYRAEGSPAFHLIVSWLRSEAISAHLTRIHPSHLRELARLLPELVEAFPDLASPEPPIEFDQRQRLFDAVARAILISDKPLLLVADDLQWCDRASIQLLHYLLRFAPATPIMVAATVRREDVDDSHPLTNLFTGLQSLDRLVEIQLDRLTHGEVTMLGQQIINRPLSTSAQDQLYRETEGNPLFVVEMLHAGWSSDQSGGGGLSPKVQAVIQSRLSQLSEPARDLIDVAATIGGEFRVDVLAGASGISEEVITDALDELWRRRIIHERSADAYDFSHDKIREVASLSLSPARRRHLHLRIAETLERLHDHTSEFVSGQLAEHYERAGAASQAVDWYVRAAETAQQLHANVEAIRHLTHALDLLGTLPATRERQHRELAILSALPAPLVATEGYRSNRLMEFQARALDLIQTLGSKPDPPLLRSLALARLSRYEYDAAREFAEQLREHGEQTDDRVLLAQSEYVLGIGAFWQGNLPAARRYFGSAVHHVRPEDRRDHFHYYGHDPGSTCLMRLGCTLWFLGYPQAATVARDAALTLIEELGHPYSRALTLVFATLLALEMRDSTRLRAYARELIATRRADTAVHVYATVEVFAGYLDVLDGQIERGIARIHQTLNDTESAEQAPGQTAFFFRVLLEACSAAGDAHAGLEVADWLLENNRGVQLWDAEAHRHRAGFLVSLGSPIADVEAEIKTALRIAHRQGALILELRAAMDLLRLQLHHGDGVRIQQARDLVTTLVDALPERSDVLDLHEATSLLATR